MAKGAPLRFTVELGGQVLSVRQPAFVGQGGKAHLPASADVLAVPVEARTIFDSLDDVAKAGFTPPGSKGKQGPPPDAGHHH